MSRWNLDNPTSTVELGSPSRSRRSLTASQQSQFTSSVFGSVPQPRTGPFAARDLAARALDGACETKQTAFEWPVRNVRALQAQLEGAIEVEEVHDVLSGDGCYFDDLAYKLHLERAPDVHLFTPLEEPREPNADPKVTLAVIALWAKYSDLPPDETFERSVFVGIKRYEAEHERSLGEPAWLWTTSETTSFSKRQEYWEVTLPSLAELLRDTDVSERDAFSIRVVIKHVSEPNLPPMVHADQQFISRRVTRQAASFLDSIRTGDVRFVVLEHATGAVSAGSPEVAADTGAGMARRRVIYAHSELLQHTEYFKAALGPAWSESADTGVRTLSVDDASFATLYWVLRWVYTDEMRFGLEPVRDVMAHVRLDGAAAARILRGDSWDFQPLLDDDDARTVRSVSSSGTHATGARSPAASASSAASGASRLTPPPPTPGQTPHDTPKKAAGPSSQQAASLAPASAAPPSSLPRISRKKAPPASSPSRPYVAPRRSHAQDPHAHPAPPPDPPSPLAAFFLAHRYGLEELQAIARDTLLRQLTPDTCVAALLATYAFPDLHAAILDYVVSP